MKMYKSNEISELAKALAAAQGELENASKNAANPHFKSKYADLAEVLNTVRPVFSKHGLSITQHPDCTDGIVEVETMVLHTSGQYMVSSIKVPITKVDAQGVGSAITYARRYSLAAVAGIAQEDDDAESAIGRKPSKPEVKLDKGIVDGIEACVTLEELQAAWNGIPVGQRAAYSHLKDAAKARIGG